MGILKRSAMITVLAGVSTMCSGGEEGASAGAGGAGGGGSFFNNDGNRTAVFPDGGPLGSVLPDGAVIGADGAVIGTALPDGTVVDPAGNVIGSTQPGGQLEIDGCIAEVRVGETIPVDIYILFDQSGSMAQRDDDGTTRLDAVRAAVSTFLSDRASRGFGAGIGYFGSQPIGEVSCDAQDYTEPAVPIGPLPQHASVVMASLNDVVPIGETPTGAAIRGACDYARDWRTQRPDHAVVMLLVTDGVPEAPVSSELGGCLPTLADAERAATECSTGAAGVPTYVVGIGPSLRNLNRIAAAGQTGAAHLVEGGDVTAEVLAALNEIRGDATIPCEFVIPPAPPGESFDYDAVNAVYTDGDGQAHRLVYVESEANCDQSGGGWFYDNTNDPHTILLCESSCSEVKAPGGEFAIALGCETVRLVR